jgi:hypothetical protein
VVVSRDRQGSMLTEADAVAPAAVQVADRFHLTLNLRQAVERELAVKRSFLRFTPKSLSALPGPAARTKESDKRQACRFVTPSSVQEQQAEVAQQRRQEQLEKLGYVGAFSRLAQLLSPWPQPAAVETISADLMLPEVTPSTPAVRQISPQVAAALLAKFRTDLTPRQEEIVDAFEVPCPGFAVMRELVLSFRSLFRLGKLDDLPSVIT